MGWFGWRGCDGDDDVSPDELMASVRHSTPAGRYSVSVRLVEAKNLQAIKAFNLMQTLLSFRLKTQTTSTDRLPNVVGKVLLERAGFEPQKRKTVLEKETAAPLWNQLFYFEDLELATDELEACNVVINVVDKSRIGKDMIIGSVDINLAQVYLNNREIWNEWMTLSDFSGRRMGSQGEICLCVTVLAEGDTPPVHLDEKFSDDEAEVAEVGAFETEKARAKRLERAEKKAKQKELHELEEERKKNIVPFILKCNVYSGRDFPRMDRFGAAGIDAYMKVSCGSAKAAQTRVVTNSNPDWNEEIVLRLLVPGGVNGLEGMPPLRLSVMDRDLTSKDDHMASTVVSLADMNRRSGAYSKPKWYCLYGGLRGMETAWFTRMSKLAKRMNAGYVDGAAYRGRVLMSFTLEEENRKNAFARARKKIAGVLDKMGREWHCYLHSQVLSVELFQLNATGKMLSAEVGMGLNSTATPSVLLYGEGGSLSDECYANVQCTLAPLLVKIPTPFEGPLAGSGAPDIFVNVNVSSSSGIRRVGFCRIPASRLMPVNETLRPTASPTNAEFPSGWTVQGWFPLRADALSNHKIGTSRRAENVKPVGQVLLRLMIRGSSTGKHLASEDYDADLDDGMSVTGDAADAQKNRRDTLERKAEIRGARVAAQMEHEFIEPLPTRPFLLRMELYQARDLPAADAHGSSDPFAVLRVGRNVAETHVVRSTTSPSWFRELFVQVDLPLVVKDKKRLPDGSLVTDDDDDDDSDKDILDPTGIAASSESNNEDVEMGVALRAPPKQEKRKGKFVGMGGGPGSEFDGIAWWAAPSMNVMVFDRDEGYFIGDNDPLSVLSLPLLHPAQREAELRGDDNFSVLASSILSFYSKFSLDVDFPDRYDKIVNYEVGALSNEPAWYPMRQLNPKKGLSVSPVDAGGYVLMYYELLPMPHEGLAKYVGSDNSFRSYAMMKLNSAVRPLEDRYGMTAIAVEIVVCGVRGLTPYRGSTPYRPSVEFELNGVTPLYFGSNAHVARTTPQMYPNGPNANMKGQILVLRGMMTKLEMVRLSLSVRVLDGRGNSQHIIATNEHPLRVRDSDKVQEDEFVSKLKSIKIKELTPEEKRARLVAEMSETVSNSQMTFGTNTTLYEDDSDTATYDSSGSEPGSGSDSYASAVEEEKEKNAQEKNASMSERRTTSITEAKLNQARSIRTSFTMRRKRAGSIKSTSDSRDPNAFKLIRKMDGSREYVPLKDVAKLRKRASLGHSTAAHLTPISEGSEAYDSDKTDASGSGTLSRYESESSDEGEDDSDAEGESDEASETNEEVEVEPESESEEEAITFDDGTGKLPAWMDGRMLIAGGLLEDELAPMMFMSIPVYHAKGFADNTSEKELAGFVKCAMRSVPLKEDTTFIAENLLQSKMTTRRAMKEAFNKKAKQRRVEYSHKKELARWEMEEDFATMPREELLELQRIAGGGDFAADLTEVTVRVYAIRGRDLRTSDPSGLCDPYLIVNQRGLAKKYGKRDEYVERTLSPWFYKVYQFTTDVPGSSILDVHVMDWDKHGKDVLIGTCSIDVEDRFFSPVWSRNLREKPPLEIRPIFHPNSSMPQGYLEMFVEIFESAQGVPEPFALVPPPVMEAELRCVVFNARKMQNKDVGGKNDLFFKLSLIGLDRTQTRFSESQETDTHWFATDGRGSFNYRNIFKLELPVSRAALRISAYDRDLFSSNDAIGEATIPLTGMCRQLMRAVDLSPDGEMATEALIEFKSSLQDSLNNFSLSSSLFDGASEGKWLKLYHPSKPLDCQGEVEILLSLLPQRKADARPVGRGRDAPNRDPELREPVRARLSLMDPLGSLSLIMGPEMVRKVLIVGCCLMFVAMIGGLAVFIINDFVGAYVQIAVQQQAKKFGLTGGGAPSMGPVPVGRR